MTDCRQHVGCVFARVQMQKHVCWKHLSALHATCLRYLFSHDLLPLHVLLLLLLLLLLQDLLLMLLFHRCCHRRVAVQVRCVAMVTRHGVRPLLSRHGVVSGRRCHGVGGPGAVWRSGVGVLVLTETQV